MNHYVVMMVAGAGDKSTMMIFVISGVENSVIQLTLDDHIAERRKMNFRVKMKDLDNGVHVLPWQPVNNCRFRNKTTQCITAFISVMTFYFFTMW